MTFSKKSWHFWVYKHVYHWWGIPNNLCPYFWKFMGALILMVVATPLYLPYALLKLVYERRWPHYYRDFGISVVTVLTLFLSTCMVWMWWRTWTNGKGGVDWVVAFGVIGWIIGFIGLIAFISEKLSEHKDKVRQRKRQERYDLTGSWSEPEKVKKIKKPWLFVELIKATYKKHCPSIEWE